jgi:hypothetical protein
MFEFLKKPVVRVPIFLAVMIGLSVVAVYSCDEQIRMVKLARKRHISVIELLARTVSEQKQMPATLGELALCEDAAGCSEVEKVFLRDFAELPEFRVLAGPQSRPPDRLGDVRVWRAHGKQSDKQELTWSGYIFRMEARGQDSRDFAIFSWPVKAGPAQLTLAYVSTDPGNIYYTAAPRYAGPAKGPRVKDLGESPFEGRIYMLPPELAGESPEAFFARANEHDGRIWAVEKITARAVD